VKLQLEQVGDDVALILPPELLARLGLSEGDELIATVTDRAIDLRRATPGESKDEGSPL
jgi:antitoxin component of MazEF toxin-antitoxin module